jgi:hypothetical protein
LVLGSLVIAACKRPHAADAVAKDVGFLPWGDSVFEAVPVTKEEAAALEEAVAWEDVPENVRAVADQNDAQAAAKLRLPAAPQSADAPPPAPRPLTPVDRDRAREVGQTLRSVTSRFVLEFTIENNQVVSLGKQVGLEPDVVVASLKGTGTLQGGFNWENERNVKITFDVITPGVYVDPGQNVVTDNWLRYDHAKSPHFLVRAVQFDLMNEQINNVEINAGYKGGARVFGVGGEIDVDKNDSRTAAGMTQNFQGPIPEDVAYELGLVYLVRLKADRGARTFDPVDVQALANALYPRVEAGLIDYRDSLLRFAVDKAHWVASDETLRGALDFVTRCLTDLGQATAETVEGSWVLLRDATVRAVVLHHLRGLPGGDALARKASSDVTRQLAAAGPLSLRATALGDPRVKSLLASLAPVRSVLQELFPSTMAPANRLLLYGLGAGLVRQATMDAYCEELRARPDFNGAARCSVADVKRNPRQRQEFEERLLARMLDSYRQRLAYLAKRAPSLAGSVPASSDCASTSRGYGCEQDAPPTSPAKDVERCETVARNLASQRGCQDHRVVATGVEQASMQCLDGENALIETLPLPRCLL